MCNCRKNKKEICLLKLQFINYVNNNMLKESNKALELLSTINCENLELVKKELQKIVGDKVKEKEIIIQSTTITNEQQCISAYNNCKKNCETARDPAKCRFDKKCSKNYNDCMDAFYNQPIFL